MFERELDALAHGALIEGCRRFHPRAGEWEVPGAGGFSMDVRTHTKFRIAEPRNVKYGYSWNGEFRIPEPGEKGITLLGEEFDAPREHPNFNWAAMDGYRYILRKQELVGVD